MCLAIVAILAAMGSPVLANLILDARMTAAVNRMVHGVHVAHQAAHRDLRPAALCKSRDGRLCNPSARWNDGWIVFANDDSDDPPQIDTGERILDLQGRLASGSITANRNAFTFRPFGTRAINGTLTFCDRRGAEKARSVIISATGRPRVAPATTGCPGL
jgi:type IV fimbrial biogenesis protein FimT